MYFGTQKSYGNRSGIQASQFISRDPRINNPIALGNISENLNRFLSAHSRKTVSHNSRKFQLREYFSKDLKAKTSLTHHFLCGPLNTKRLTRKTINGNFDDEFVTQSLNVDVLYNNSKQSNKPPWIEQLEPNSIPERLEKPPKPKIVSFDLNLRFNENFRDDTGLARNEQVLQDGEVPDSMRMDLKDSCPLYDGNEYEQYSSQMNKNVVSDDENSEPDISRYNFFLGSAEKLSNIDIDFEKKDDRQIRHEPLPREKIFVPLLTSSQDNGFSIVE